MAILDAAVLGDELMTTIAALRRLVRRRLRSAVPGPRLRGAQVELLQVIRISQASGSQLQGAPCRAVSRSRTRFR